MTQYLIAIGTTARSYILVAIGALVVGVFVFRWWARKESARGTIDRVKLKIPIFGEIWLKYQVAQLARILSTLLTGGIPLVQAMETAADSLNTPLLQARGGSGRQERARRPAAIGIAEGVETVPAAGDRHDRSGRIDRRAAADAEQRGGVFRGGREYAHAGDALADRAGDHDRDGRVRGVCVDFAVSADLFAWRIRFMDRRDDEETGHFPTYGDDFDKVRLLDPTAEAEQARAMAARYRCEYVDLREAAIDHDLFRSIPVDLMFRYNFVPMQAQQRDARYRPFRSAQPQPDRRADAAAQPQAAHQGGDAFADRRAAQEDRAIAARAGRSHRRLHAGRGGGRRRQRRDAFHRQAHRHRQRHRAGHQAGGHHHLQRAGAAGERYSHRIARPGSGHQVPHRRRAALRHAAHRQGLAVHHHFAHQGDERAGYRREARAAGRPLPRALQEPPDRFPRLHHAHDSRRRRRAPRAGQGIDEREVRQALAGRGGLRGKRPGEVPPLHHGAVRHGAGDRARPGRARPPRCTPR